MEEWKKLTVESRVAAGENPPEVYFDMYLQNIFSEEQFTELMLSSMTESELKAYLFYNNLNVDFGVDFSPYPADFKMQVALAIIERCENYTDEFVYQYRFAIVGDKESEDRYESIRGTAEFGAYDDTVEIHGVLCKIGFNYGD